MAESKVTPSIPGSTMAGVALPKARSKKYHTRSPWACDECKLRRKKCDGKDNQPCRTCVLYKKECTYELKTKPSQRPTARIRELEDDLRSVRALLERVKSDLTGRNLRDTEVMLEVLKPGTKDSPQTVLTTPDDSSNSEGLQVLIGHGHFIELGSANCLHGSYSGAALICSTLEFFPETDSADVLPLILNLYDRPSPTVDVTPFDSKPEDRLPTIEEATTLFNSVLTQNHPGVLILGSEPLLEVLEESYSLDVHRVSAAGKITLSCFHAVLALSYLLDIPGHRKLGCESAMQKADKYFVKCLQLFAIVDHNDAVSLQTLILIIQFLISTSRLSSAYTYINILSAAVDKLGLQAKDRDRDLTLEEQRIVSMLVESSLYVCTVLGLPLSLPVDNMEPGSGFTPMTSPPAGHQTTLSDEVASRLCELVSLTATTYQKVRTSCWQTKIPTMTRNSLVTIDESVLDTAQKGLTRWSHETGSVLSGAVLQGFNLAEVSLAKQELELSFYWSQLLLYFPFLHYLHPLALGQQTPESASRPALACLKVAVNTILRCETLLNQGLEGDPCAGFMLPGSWRSIYTLFLAVLSLIFLISIHEGTSKPSEAWDKAERGIKVLAALRCKEGGAGRCLDLIQAIVGQLNYTVAFDFDEIERTTRRVCDRHGPEAAGVSANSMTDAMVDDDDVLLESPEMLARGEVGLGPIPSADMLLARAQDIALTDDLGSFECQDETLT